MGGACQCSSLRPPCTGGKIPLTFTLADGSASYQLCSDPLTPSSTTNNTWVFSTCWNYNCLDSTLAARAPAMTLSAVSLTSGASAYPAAGSVVSFTFMQPNCADASGTLTASDPRAPPLQLDRNSAIVLPATGLQTLNISASIKAGCNDQYLAIVMGVVYQNVAALPAVPPATCPCWQEPVNNTCPGIQLPIYLSTLSADAATTPATAALVSSAGKQGKSFSQCIDPANYDPETGRMAMSYCWRYECLPVEFASQDFEASITLSRWNIARMPGGASFRTRVRATEGVSVFVQGPPKNASETAISYGGTPTSNNLLDVGVITLPASGVRNFTFTWRVPVGFNDLSASVEMDAMAGPSPPPPAELPDDPRCRCHDVPDAQGVCADGLIPAVWTLRRNTSVTETHCIPAPYYDTILHKFAFSMCYQWACLTNRLFWGQPYIITLRNITQYDVASIPIGLNSLYMDALHPAKVNMTVQINLNPRGAAPQSAPAPLGPFSVDQGSIEIPSVGVSSLDASISIPAMPWLDGNSVAFEIRAGAAPPPPPNPPPRPPIPPLSPVAPETTVVIANFTVLDKINSQAELNAILATTSSAVSAKLIGYLVIIPTSFVTYNNLNDCSASTQAQFRTTLAQNLGGITPSAITTRCSLAYRNVGSRRRLMRWLLQDDGPVSTSACDNAVISIQIALDLVATTDTRIEDSVSSIKKKIFDAYGGDTQVCQATEVISTKVSVQQVLVGNRRKLAADPTTCTAAAATVPRPITGLQCDYTTAAALGSTAPPPEESSGLSGGQIAGIVIGAVAGVAMVALVVGIFVARRQRDTERKAINTAMYSRFGDAIAAQPAQDPDLATRQAVAEMPHANPAYRQSMKKNASVIRRTNLDDPMADRIGSSETPRPQQQRIAALTGGAPGSPGSSGTPATTTSVPHVVPQGGTASFTAPPLATELSTSRDVPSIPMRDATHLLSESEVGRRSGSGAHTLAAAAPSSSRPTSRPSSSNGTPVRRGSANAGAPGTPSRLIETDREPAVGVSSRPSSGKSSKVHPVQETGQAHGAGSDDEEEPMSEMVERMLQGKAASP